LAHCRSRRENVMEATFDASVLTAFLTRPARSGYIYRQETGNGSLSMKRRNWLATMTLATALGAALPVQAGKLYKYVDEQGNITYSQSKPPGQEAETIRLKSATLDSSGAQERLDRLNEQAGAQDKDREFAENSASATAERDKRMANNCKIAQGNMRILRTTSRIQDKDASGQSYFLDESAIQAKMADTQRQIDDNCN
jgi:hypothetical protein